MLIGRAPDIRFSEVTDERVYMQRRDFIRLAGGAALATAGASLAAWEATARLDAATPAAQSPLQNVRPKVVSTDERLNSFEDITSYNNFYEFGPGPKDPQRYAGRMKTSPWTVKIDGLCDTPATYHLEDLIRPHQLEERIYRHRCVEAWSMVIPWVGVPLSAVLRRATPQANATFVEFTTLHRPSEMPGQNERTLEWPYVEGLRMDEAMHPLTILAVGLYGRTLMNQNGAPIRLVVPWKYRLQEHQIDRAPPARRSAAEDRVGNRESERVWVLFECQPRRVSPEMESGSRAPASATVRDDTHSDVQRLR